MHGNTLTFISLNTENKQLLEIKWHRVLNDFDYYKEQTSKYG